MTWATRNKGVVGSEMLKGNGREECVRDIRQEQEEVVMVRHTVSSL